MKIWNINQEINKGDLVFTIIPNEPSSVVGKIKAPSLNSGKLRIGQNVNIRLNGYPVNEYGIIKGKIMQVSLISKSEGEYLVDITLPNKLVTTYDKKLEFKQEMQGHAEIITEDMRLFDRLFYQFKDIYN